MSKRVSCAIDCNFGFWPTSVMIASAEWTDQLQSPTDLADQVKAAVDDWLKNSVEGQVAHQKSSQDFNVGDLLQHIEVPSLIARLAARGVTEFTLSEPVQMVGWDHDERLFREAL